MNVKTLFITNRDDISIEYLISKFRSKSLNYLRLNSEDIDKIYFEIDPMGKHTCYIDSSEYCLNSVQSVIFRRTPTKFNSERKDPNTPYLSNEKKHFLEGLYLSLSNAKWINPMFATHIAERKLYQLQVATQLGLKVPKSIITNSADKANRFLKSTPQAIIKPISNGLQVLNDATYSIYTSEINSNFFNEFNLNTIFETPVFLQEKILNKADIRVTIIGNQFFTVKIEKNGCEEVDWRKPEIQKKYSLIELPNKIKDSLHKLNKFFGLIYSAIDLIQKPNNEYVFLEVNPVGEWVWLEKELNINISEAIINELL